MYIPRVEYGKLPEKKIIIFSGAGISSPSGISTFRDTDGLWENHDIDEICNESTWKKNFDIVHDFYNERRSQLKEVFPNIAHQKIKDFYKRNLNSLWNITQNVDDLFDRLEIPTLHLHGFLPEMKCTNCNSVWNINYKKFKYYKDKIVTEYPNCEIKENNKSFFLYEYPNINKWFIKEKSKNELFYSKQYLIKELIKKKKKLFLKDNEHEEVYINENNNLSIKENYRCNNCGSYKAVKPNIVFFGGNAPMYSYLNRALEYLKNPDSIIIIIGTMGNVVQINEKIKKYPCKKILCNMEKSKFINDEIFDKVYYESIETAIFKIEKDIEFYNNI